MIEMQNVSFQIKNKYLLKEVNCRIHPNELLVVMGANGAGKSTLLKLLSGSLVASTGKILIDQKPIHQYRPNELALKRAVLSQHYEIAFPLTVKEIVLMGRYPYFKTNPSQLDIDIVNQVLENMGITELSERKYQTLSGGEAQKVQMCRVLAQIKGGVNDKRFLLLDEPVSHLDIKYQYHLLEIAKSILDQNTSVIAVLHDINLALKFADRILFVKEGKIVHQHVNSESFDISIIKKVFDIEASLLSKTQDNRQWVCF